VRLLPLVFALAAPAASLRTDIEFARVGEVSLTLDAYVPDGPGPFAAVIVVHGGGFIAGDKQTYVKPLFEPLTRGGFAWFTINYRLAPVYPFPAAVEDVERAVAWLRANAAAYKVDPSRIALMGESAGGHLVAFVGTSRKRSARVRAVVSFYGPHDFEARERALGAPSEPVRKFLGVSTLDDADIARMRAASPISHVHRGMPPYLLIHGTADAQVPHDQSTRMCERMKAAGASCEVFTIEGAPHGVERWEKEPAHQTYKAKMVDWLRAKLGR
jgi:acetyl esterase